MEISALSTSMSMAEIHNQIGVALLSKNLDTAEVLGDGMVKMLEASVTPHLGGNIDILV